jgi:hypothetical protein
MLVVVCDWMVVIYFPYMQIINRILSNSAIIVKLFLSNSAKNTTISIKFLSKSVKYAIILTTNKKRY